jgi:hypothetical protein
MVGACYNSHVNIRKDSEMATEERDEEQAYLASVYREKMQKVSAAVVKEGWTVSGMSTAEIVKANRLETVKAARRIIEEETATPSHGSAEDRGSSDRYYGRRYDPHYYVWGSYTSERIQENKLTDEDRRLYKKGWEEETDRKDWG